MKHLAAASLLFISSTSAALPRHATVILQNARVQIQRRPALAHGIIGFALFGASDAFAQEMEASSSHLQANEETAAALATSPTSRVSFDMVRFLSAGAIGAFFGGHVYPFAYKRLDMLWEGTGLLTIAKKSLVEVFTVGIFANSVSMGARGLLMGKKPTEVLSHVKDEMPSVTLNDFRVWFPYNLVAFGLIPISIRPATTSLMECLWQTYISLRSNDYEHGQECRSSVET